MHQLKRVARLFLDLRHLGISYVVYLIVGYLIPAILYRMLYGTSLQHLRRWLAVAGTLLASSLFIILTLLFGVLWAAGMVATGLSIGAVAGRLHRSGMIRNARRLMALHYETERAGNFVAWRDWPVAPAVRAVVEAKLVENGDHELVLGCFDRDGRVSGIFGELPRLVSVAEGTLARGQRYHVQVVLVDGLVLIRKDFRGKRGAFIREWYNLAVLAGKANVPAVYRADERNGVLYKSLIAGHTLRDLMVEAGADILLAQTDADATLTGLMHRERLAAIWARGRAVLAEIVPSSFLATLEAQINAVHAAGLVRLSLTFGNVMVDNGGQPWLIDFEHAISYHSPHHPLFLLRRDRDRSLFNEIYGTELLTERSARAAVAEDRARSGMWYSPIDFGHGFGVGHFWSIESGSGRWQSLNKRHLPALLQGRRILDLGSNNGLMPLFMLRSGAAQVVAVELDPVFIERARLVQRIFEWRDMRVYRLYFKNCNMLELLGQDWGRFDVITAFCSLYYLSEEEMVAMVRRAAALAPVMILQGNSRTRAEAADNKAQKSSVAFLASLLKENGFPDVVVFGAGSHPRPLLVGRRGE